MNVYTVVDVQCGVAVEARCFSHVEEAAAYQRRLCRGRDLEEDDIQLFECVLDDVTQQSSNRVKSIR